MKPALAFIVLLAFAKPIFPFLEYALNYDYISKVLCVNKNKPKLKCNGKCYLMQQLAKNAAEKDSSSNKKLPTKIEFQLVYFEEFRYPNFSEISVIQNLFKRNLYYQNNYTSLYQSKLFKPPQV